MINLIWSGCLLLLLSGCGWDGTPTRQNDFVPLTSIEISAVSSTIAAQTSTRLTATGDFSGLFTRDISDQVVWSSDSPAVADFVTPTGRSRVTGLIPGAAVLRATVGSVSSTFALTVSDATVTSMAITPATPSVPNGRTSQLTVIGTFSDATTQDLTFDADWTSTPGTFATVSNDPASKGFVTALTEGSETITATFTFGSISATTTLTVTVPVLQSITISPANPSILTLATGKFTAIGTYSDGSTPDITSQVAWSSSDSGIATITTGGAATTLTQGTTTISATLNGINGTTNLKVTGGNLTGITVTPATVTLVKDISSPISAKGTFSNGSTRDITGAVQWTTANTSLASVTPSGGNLALLNPLALTSVPTTITATSGIRTGTAALTVIAPLLTSIAFSATILDVTAGTSSPLAVNATFSDGTIQDVTALSALTPNNPAIATVITGGLATKRVTGIAAGTTTISATYGGLTVTAPATVTVRSRVLQSLTLSPTPSTVNVGNQAQFTATATYSDGTTVDVTRETGTDWTINNQNVAILADKVNQPGLIVGVDSGSTNLTASFGGKTPNQTTTITVAGP